MIDLLYLFLLAPLWAVITTWFGLHVLNSSIAVIIYLIGLLRGIVSRKVLMTGLVVTLVQIAVFAGLVWLSMWLFQSLLSVGQSKSQKVTFWIVTTISGISYVPELLAKVYRTWEFAHVPGAFEEYMWKRKMGLVK